MLTDNKKLTANARTLRVNMTPEERHLWYDFLKRLPVTVRRQYTIGNYIVDFYIAAKKIVIELDGIQHTSPEHRKADEARDKTLANWGIQVLRYTNQQVNRNFCAVTNDILRRMEMRYEDVTDNRPTTD